MSELAPHRTAPRAVSGIQPSGTKHLGNYFGAIKQHIELQDELPGACFWFIADYHALTTLRDPGLMRDSVAELARTYLALGLDPDKALLFRQTDVPEVTELAWMLATVTGMGLLERAHAYKAKVAEGIKPTVGLFTYPVLMAADILAYDASIVPVGIDQMQHVEMARDVATHFNETWGAAAPVLQLPEPRLSPMPYVTGTDGKKMSTSYGNTIPIFASGKQLQRRVNGIVTDPTPLGSPLDRKRCNVFELLSLFVSEEELDRISTWYDRGERDGRPFGYGDAKRLLVAHIESYFAAARARRLELLAAPERVDEVLRRSAERAREVARATVARCKRACGLL